MIVIEKFAGEIPRVSPRLLPSGFAQTARNCKLVDGWIVPLRNPAPVRTAAAGTKVFFKRGATWFDSPAYVDVAPAPIAENRLYITGDGAPKMVADAVVYPLALKAPEKALTATVSGTPDKDTQESVIYAYTYVTIWDEESPPSPLSTAVLRSPDQKVTLTGFISPGPARGINRIRIYRSQTSALGVTELYFIYERVFPLLPTFVDLLEDFPAQEAIPSLSFNPPPDDMQGIIPLPNGMMAAFSGKSLCFSEPWKPHAWPEKYRLSTSYDIVGLGAFGQSIVVMTTGFPYIVTGTTPESMVMERLEVNYPCVAKRSIVDLGYSVCYACPDGLVSVSAGGASLISRALISRDDWQFMRPETFEAAQHDGRYIVTYTPRSGPRETAIIDLTGENPFITHVDAIADYMFFEVGAGKLYFLVGRSIMEWDAQDRPPMNMTWRSKQFVAAGEGTFGAMLTDALPYEAQASAGGVTASISDATIVHSEFPVSNDNGVGSQTPVAAGPFRTRIYAEGNLIRETPVINTVDRLPARLARMWEVELTGGNTVQGVALSPSPSALMESRSVG